jgi:hypothetical protein
LKNKEVMKTTKYIAGLLMMVAIGISSASGQGTTQRSTAQRGTVQRVATRTSVSQEEKKKSDQKNAQQRTTVQRQMQKEPENSRHEVAHRSDNANISTRNNPRSDYRVVYRPPARRNDYSHERYYGGHYYHSVYPKGKANMHYHRDTYIHGYHVLYRPVHVDIFWTRSMYNDYRRWYPNYHWRYSYGYRIKSLSVFDARYNLGEVAMVYGRVYATWYNRETDDYLLFFGGDYPHQEFSLVLPGHIARKFSWRPEEFFLGEHLTVTGLITTFEGIPEIIVKNKRQIGIY